MATADEEQLVTCPRCGRQKPVDGCGCGGQGPAAPAPEGWVPELTPKDRPRLPLTARPD